MAKSYRRSEKHEKANQLYLYIVEHWPKTEHAILSQRDLATSNAELGKMESAQAAIDKLLTEFSGNEHIAQTIYEIANYYCQLQQYEKAVRLYQYILGNWPDDVAAIQSQTGIALANIGLANDPNTEAAVDKLIADFSDHPALPAAILRIEEEYYKKILAAETWVRGNYLHPVKIWEKVMSKFPDFFHDDPDLYYFIACCYYQLGQYENAIYYYSIVIDNWPDYKYVRGAQRLMETCQERLINVGK